MMLQEQLLLLPKIPEPLLSQPQSQPQWEDKSLIMTSKTFLQFILWSKQKTVPSEMKFFIIFYCYWCKNNV